MYQSCEIKVMKLKSYETETAIILQTTNNKSSKNNKLSSSVMKALSQY